MVRRLGLALVGCAILSACGQGENDPGPGGVTVGEARALDEAAQMLEERRAPLQALQPTAVQPAQGDGAAQPQN